MRYVFAMIHAEQFLYCRKIKARRAVGLNVSPSPEGLGDFGWMTSAVGAALYRAAYWRHNLAQ
jgi:hypothetical protein